MNGRDDCPKRMVYGPCGGVDPFGDCEVDGRRCPFMDSPAPTWQTSSFAPRRNELATVIVDVRPDIRDPEFGESIDVLAAAGVIGLIGDHLDEPAGPESPEVVSAVVARGLRVVATVSCRNRTPTDCGRIIAELGEAGAGTILCVTGDHPAARFGPDLSADFALDGTRLASMARSLVPCVAVAESPASAPIDARASRLLDKQRAGADLAILNHAGDTSTLVDFVDRARAEGVEMPMVAPVPVITDVVSLHALNQFPGVHLPVDLVEMIGPAIEPRLAGVRAAVEFGRALLASGRFDHLNLSGRATSAGALARSRIMAAVARGITDEP